MNQLVKISIISIFVLSVYFYLFSSGLIHFLALGSSYYFGDYFAFPKAVECYVLGFNPTTGSGTGSAPKRTQGVGKWVTTGSQINKMKILSAAGSRAWVGGQLKVWGSD